MTAKILSFCFLCLFVLLNTRWGAAYSSEVNQPAVVDSPIELVPDQMQKSGDVTTQANCGSAAICSWLAGMPKGSILLGVDPKSTDTANWGGGSATAQVSLPNPYGQTRYVLQITWPDRDGKGLHSPRKNQSGRIYLDGQLLWSMRTTQAGTFGDYYAAEHLPVQTTIVVSQAAVHTLKFETQAKTAWDISQIRLSAYPMPAVYSGIGYSPYRDCQIPGGEKQPSTLQIQEDLFKLSHTTNAIRTYSSLGPNGKVPALAHSVGLTVFPGAWLDYPKTTLAEDEAEIQGLINLACQNDVPGVIVGNEYYLRHRTPDAIPYMKGRIQQVKNGIQTQCGKNVPVTTAEIDDLMFRFEGGSKPTTNAIQAGYLPVIEEVDFVMEHIYPFWNGMPVDGAAAYVIQRYTSAAALLKKLYPSQNKWLMIGETGWPSGGEPNGRAVPSLYNQQKYMLELLPLAEQQQVQMMYFDAFDELWKIEEGGGVGQRWGYAYHDRTAKYPFYGVLIPSQDLPAVQPRYANAVFLPAVSGSGDAAVLPKTFLVADEWPSQPGTFVPSGWMGDIDQIEMDECDRVDPHDGEMAMRVSFTPDGPTGGAGVYWQYPEKNWGDKAPGIDLSWANKLTFWAKGNVGGEKVRFFVGGIGGHADPYPDSLRPEVSSGFIKLTREWKQYTINLAGKDLSHVIGGFGWATDRCANPSGAVFYLDKIQYEYEAGLKPPPRGKTFGIYSDAASVTNHFSPSGWMGNSAALSLDECSAETPHSGSTAIKVSFPQTASGWAGVYWLEPSENWGERPGGFDLRGAARLTFWARSAAPGGQVQFLIGGVGYPVNYAGDAICGSPNKPYPDSVCPKIQATKALTTQWTKYTLTIPAGTNLTRVTGGFGFVVKSPVTFYLDDIQYEYP